MNLDRFGFKAKSRQKGRYWLYASLDFYDGIGSYGVRYHLEPGGEASFNPAGIDPETLCQSTGIRDSEGTPIYENDIVQVIQGNWGSDNYSFRYFTIHYHEPSKTFEMHGETDYYPLSTLITWIKLGAKCFVVGNKFDKEVKDGKLPEKD